MADKMNKTNIELLLQKLQGGGASDNSTRDKQLLYLFMARWRWFVVSVVIMVGLATLYILRSQPVYTRLAFLLVKEDAKGKTIGSDVASMFANLGLEQANSNVNNELIALQMPAVVREVVHRLSLDMNYQQNGYMHKETLYGKDLPVKVQLLQKNDAETASFTMQLLSGKKVMLDDFRCSEMDIESRMVSGTIGDTLRTPLGKMIIAATPEYKPNKEYPLIFVSHNSLFACVDACTNNLEAKLSSKDATIIELSYKDVSIARAEDFLNTLIAVYNEEWMKDKNQITVSTSQFISDRLAALVQELGDVDADISTYKSANQLPDVEKSSELFMQQAQDNNNKLIALSTQIVMAESIRGHLSNVKNRDRLIPVNMGLENANIEAQINEYNTKQLRRNNLVLNSSDQSPLVIELDQSLASMRSAIITSIDNHIASLQKQRGEISYDSRRTSAKIVANPEQAKYLQSVGRQQKVKEALYLFLLQKREENELSQAFIPYNIRILTPPSGNLTPIEPRRGQILAIAFILGLLFPAVLITVRENLNTTIRGRKDLERLTVPFAGEIPLFTGKKKYPFTKKVAISRKQIIVKEGGRDVMNEAFRVLRTNIEFMSDEKTDVALLTSFNPNSGKTFLTMNISASLAVKGKRVLAIDGDMRKASLSAYIDSPKKGLSNYLAGHTENMDEIIYSVSEQYPGLDIIPVGTIPPNPTELLFSERLKLLVSEMRNRYDYIFIDCAPIGMVADTQILEKQVDSTFFVVRAGLLERSMLGDLEHDYKEQKFKKLSVILNGTPIENHRYGYYGYYYGRNYDEKVK